MKPDWIAIEADFLATGMSYSMLASKWGVSISTLKKKAMRGKWADKLGVIVVKAEEEPVPKKKEPKQKKEPEPEPAAQELMSPEEMAVEDRRRRARRMIETTDAMMDRIIDALGLIAPDNTYALATLIKALKDLREMQGLNRSALDVEEQKARIAKLQHDALTAEDKREPLVVQFVNMDGADI